jgi:hypothetical protein
MQIPDALKTDAVLIGLAVVAAVIIKKNMVGLMAGASSAVVEAVTDAGAGVAIGIGDVIGVPRTNESECEAAMREDRKWDASFACPLSVYTSFLMNGYIDTKNKGLQ